jgi:hypothetical protein
MPTGRLRRYGIALVGILVLIGVAATAEIVRRFRTPPPPQRTFTTSDLLVQSLPGWIIESGPEERPGHDFNLPRAIAGSTIRFLKPPAGANATLTPAPNSDWEPVASLNQWAVKFANIRDAASVFSDHYFVGGPVGSSTSGRWQTPVGLDATSESAQQFRIVCDHAWQPPSGAACYLEARYDEFYILAQYTAAGVGLEAVLSDLDMIAKSVDSRVTEYIGARR